MSKISIYVMAHKAFECPKDPVYIPMQVGAALHDDLGYLSDSTKDNISVKNPNFCELTGLYWVWKNDYKSDYVGLCHYRRYFLDTNNNPISGDEFNRFFKNCEANGLNVMVTSPKAIAMEGATVMDFYEGSGHNKIDLIEARNSIERLTPEYLSYFDRVINGNATYFANMLVGKKSTVDDYCRWLFTILFDLEKNLDITGYDDYNKRVFGFVSERLLMVWLLKNKVTVQECMVTMVDDRV